MGRKSYPVMADLIKKRKLLSVELDLPESKHKCLEINCDDTMSLQEDGEAIAYDSGHSLHASQVESVKDSNSFPDEADTAVSAFVEVNYGFGHAMGKDRASGSSDKWSACDYPQQMPYLSDAEKELISESSGRKFDAFFSRCSESPHEYGLQMRQVLEEQLLEFVVDLAYECSEYANECHGQRANKEVEGCNYMFSGRSGVTNEPLDGSKRPTIDKEFEEYFSMLMM